MLDALAVARAGSAVRLREHEAARAAQSSVRLTRPRVDRVMRVGRDVDGAEETGGGTLARRRAPAVVAAVVCAEAAGRSSATVVPGRRDRAWTAAEPGRLPRPGRDHCVVLLAPALAAVAPGCGRGRGAGPARRPLVWQLLQAAVAVPALPAGGPGSAAPLAGRGRAAGGRCRSRVSSRQPLRRPSDALDRADRCAGPGRRSDLVGEPLAQRRRGCGRAAARRASARRRPRRRSATATSRGRSAARGWSARGRAAGPAAAAASRGPRPARARGRRTPRRPSWPSSGTLGSGTVA